MVQSASCIRFGFFIFYRPLLPVVYDQRSAWLQVGQSYQGVVEDRSDEGPKGFKQGSAMPPTDKVKQDRDKDVTSGAGMTKRPKAADFFGIPVDGQTAEVQMDIAEESASKRRHSYPSDGDNSDNGHKNANSDLPARERRLMTGKFRSTTKDNYLTLYSL